MDVATLKTTVYEAWREFYSLSSIYRRLPLWPLTKRAVIVWLINLGIHKVVSHARNTNAPRNADQPLSQVDMEALRQKKEEKR
jgi:hypothetical protein